MWLLTDSIATWDQLPATAEQINVSAALWQQVDMQSSAELQHRHEKARSECYQLHQETSTVVLKHGGWCLSKPVDSRPVNHRHSGGLVSLPHNQTFALPRGHYVADGGLVAGLAEMLLANSESIIDFGAGVGEYGHALKAIDARIEWRGYDGAGNVEDYTHGFVRFVDLTMPLSLPKADWVLSLEVGEHIPKKFEGMYFRNLHAHSCRDVVGSWAPPGQVGTGHVNLLNRSYVLQRFAELGYKADASLLHKLVTGRHGWSWPQIRNNLFVVVRERPAC